MGNKYYITSGGELYHYGVLGMKWGVRRYQKKDGTLTLAGKKRLVDHMKETFDDNYSKADKVRRVYTENGIKEIPDKDYSSALRKTEKDLADDIRNFYDHPKLKKARDEYYSTMRVGEEFYNNEKLLREFRNKAYFKEADYYAKKYGERGDWVDVSYGEHVNRSLLKKMHISGDRDNCEFGAFHTYLESKGIDTTKYHRDVFDARRKYRKECEKFTKRILGVYGNRTVADYNLEKNPFTGNPGRRIEWSARKMVGAVLDNLERDENLLRKVDGLK